MRILIIKNSKHKNSYTSCIHTLIEETGRRHDYQIIFTDNFKEGTDANDTITFLTLQNATSINRLLQQQRLKSFIKKNKIDLLIQNAGFLVTQKIIPQLLIADDMDHLPAIKQISFSRVFLLTYSQAAKQVITDRGFTNTIHVTPFSADIIYQPINWSMRQQVKIDYTEGSEYFIVIQSFQTLDEIVLLLRAFSGFKKWQQSSMKLVFAGKLYIPQSDWEDKLNTYKYREDVVVYNKLPEEELAKLLAGAYACIHLPKKDNDLLPLLQSIQCHTPVITSETISVKEYIAQVGLIAAYNNDEISKKMVLMYKDENLRNNLRENCTLEAEKFSKEKALQLLQTVIL